MRHQNKVKTLGREKAPREMMLRNLASSVIIYEKVSTTLAKAKVIRPIVERIITDAKNDNLASRRKVLAYLPQKMAVKKVFEVLGKKYKDKNGGYTRITKTGTRQGDAAEMAQIELV